MIEPLEQDPLVGITIRAIDAGIDLEILDRCMKSGIEPEELFEAVSFDCVDFWYLDLREHGDGHIAAMCQLVGPWKHPMRRKRERGEVGVEEYMRWEMMWDSRYPPKRSSEASERLAIEIDRELTGDDWDEF